MQHDSKPENAILWPRISLDRDKDEHGVDDQETDLKEFAGNLGWGAGHVIKENDTSAYKRTRKVPDGDGGFVMRTNRPVFRKILRMLRDGEADGLIVRDLDRAVRDPRDLEDLIDVIESRTPRIPVESIRGTLRLNDGAGIMVARMFAAKANEDSRITAARVADTKRHRAAEGKYRGGPRPYGYKSDGVTLREDEADVIRKAADAVLDGETLSSIVNDMNRRGVPLTGKTNSRTAGRDVERKWGVVTLRQLLMRARNAGLVERHGEIYAEAEWDAIIPEEKWRAVCDILSDPSRRTSPGPKPKHLGSNIYLCGVCQEEEGIDAYMVGQNKRYRCKRKNHHSQYKEPIDAIVAAKITGELAKRDAVRLLRKTEAGKTDNARLNAAAAGIRRKLAEVRESYKSGRIDIRDYETVSSELRQELAVTESAKASYERASADPLAGIAGKPDAAEIWETLPIERQRAIIRETFEVFVYRQPVWRNQHTPFDPECVFVDKI